MNRSLVPESIFVTTFTDKAPRNLEDRISHYRNQIIRQWPELSTIDTSKLRLGTLHTVRCRPASNGRHVIGSLAKRYVVIKCRVSYPSRRCT
jgi:superfamily I DNA/RNA helicase